jgi:PleD family two-component response regulator
LSNDLHRPFDSSTVAELYQSSWRYNEVTPMESKRTDCRAHALCVLVVEDDEDTAASLAILLRLYGYEVEVAADGPSALRAVQASPPDVVLLDIGLPKMNGWLVAKRIREHLACRVE